jgi:polysaccharide export outer membrane protein
MRNILTPLLTAVALLLSVTPVLHAQEEMPSAVPTADYKINPGDILQISVWREEDLQREVLVRPDGKFSFPLAGDIDARNKSVEEVRSLITERLSRYIPDLVVSVAVLQINGNKIYVIGQVQRPGDFVVNPQVDVLQALAMAGGVTPFAEVNDIQILRRTGDNQQTLKFRYRDVENGKRLEQNILLKAGDVVVVP